MNMTQILTIDSFSIEVGQLPEATLDYLVANGFSQAMRDSSASAAANIARKHMGDAFTSVADYRAGCLDIAGFNAEVAEEALRLRNAKFQALLSGEIDVMRTIGPKANTVEAEEAKVVKELTKLWLSKRGIKYPSGKSSAEAVAKYEGEFAILPGIADKVRKEAQRRFKESQALAAMLGDL